MRSCVTANADVQMTQSRSFHGKRSTPGDTDHLLSFRGPFYEPLEVERVKGIEPSSQAWEAHILPLNHTRVWGSAYSQESINVCLPLFVKMVQTPMCLLMLVLPMLPPCDWEGTVRELA